MSSLTRLLSIATLASSSRTSTLGELADKVEQDQLDSVAPPEFLAADGEKNDSEVEGVNDHPT